MNFQKYDEKRQLNHKADSMENAAKIKQNKVIRKWFGVFFVDIFIVTKINGIFIANFTSVAFSLWKLKN